MTEIPKTSWPAYFRDLARQYEGWMTTVELLDPELGDQLSANGLPLQGISYDPVGSMAGSILVELGDAGTPFETRTIRKPINVRFAITRPGAEADLEIQDEEGVITLVQMRHPTALPPPGRDNATKGDAPTSHR